MIKLDLKDRKILFELDTNSRQSYQQIANKVRLSKDSIFYRIKRLEKEGVIERYQTLIDVGKLGYISFRIFYKLQNTTSKKEEEIINYLKNQRIVGWMVSVEGNWDINTWILCKGISELDEFWKNFAKKYINYLADKKLSIFTDITYFSRAYFLPDKRNDLSIRFVTEPKEVDIDKIDIEILKLLVLNARIPILEIADKLKVSSKMISYRIKNLQKKKVIVGYRTMFNLQKLGYLYYRLHIKVHNINEQKAKEFRAFAFHHPNIIYDHYSLGGPDLEIDIQVGDVEKLREIIKEIKDKFSGIIQNYEVLQYLKEHKYIYMPIGE